MRCTATRSARPRWRNWCTRRRPAIRSSRSSFFLRWPRKDCSRSITARRAGPGTSTRIHAKGYTDNVVDLMVGKLSRLPVDTQQALQQLACLGNSAEIALLAMVYEDSQEALHSDSAGGAAQRTRPPCRGRLHVPPRPGAGSRLFADSGRCARRGPSAHRETAGGAHPTREAGGGDLRDRQSAQPRRRADHLTRRARATGGAQPDRGQTRQSLDGLRLGAHAISVAGAALLAEDGWERRQELIFALELHRAECEFLTGALAAAEERLTMLSSRAATTDRTSDRRVLAHGLCTRPSVRATARSTSVSTTSGIWAVDWSPHPTEEEARREYERIWSQLGSRTIEELIDLPLMSDPVSLATLDVLTKVVPPALFTDENLYSLAICRMVNLSLEHGNSDASCLPMSRWAASSPDRISATTRPAFGSVGSATTWSNNAGCSASKPAHI